MNYKQEINNIRQFYNLYDTEAKRLKQEIISAKNKLETQPVKQDFLSSLQFMLQEKNIAFFSNLITTLTHDVIHNNDEHNKKTINFDLSIKNSLPALHIHALNNDNQVEEITSGGLKNVIATGLRALALWRLNQTGNHKGLFEHRNFIFMDEPDCWIAESAMPNYAKLLYQISTHFNIQILMVTHKNQEYFKPYAKLYEIKKTESGSQFDLISEVETEQNAQNIQSIQLKNFKSFKDAQIDLSPNLTVIVGKSDSGKSVVMEAFNAVINNDSNDDVIRHFENKASISIKADEEHEIIWERIRKTNPDFPQKVKYQLFQNNNKIHDEYNSFAVPDKVERVLKMRKLDKTDVHLGLQEDMTFLFSSRISDTERAKILSLGKETAYVNKMMEALKAETRELKTSIKLNEKRYNIIRESLLSIPTPEEIGIYEEPIDKLKVEIETREKQLLKMKEKLDVIDKIKPLINSYQTISFTSYDNQYELQDLSKIEAAIKKYDKASEKQKVYQEIRFTDWQNVGKWVDVDKIGKLLFLHDKLETMKSIVIPEVKVDLIDVERVLDCGKKLKVLSDSINNKKDELQSIEKELLTAKEVIHNIGMCPLCGSELHE